MTDETYEEVAAFVKANAVPPTDYIPLGFPVDVVVEETYFGRPTFSGDCREEEWNTRAMITVSRADFADLRRRLDEKAREEEIDRAIREALAKGPDDG